MTPVTALFASIPHSGEQVPDLCPWLKSLPERTLMCDVDRFVDILYQPALSQLGIQLIKTEWHRYAADLNRFPEDVDAGSVAGNANPIGSFRRGFHWQVTTLKESLMPGPMSAEDHQKLIDLIYEPFHKQIKAAYAERKYKGLLEIYHLDLHSMPSVGTEEHRDPGQTRAQIVVSDCKGKSSKPAFVKIVQEAYEKAGFQVALNWPYYGGRVSEQYGAPSLGQHAVQVEMSRALYMDEVTKQILPSHKKVQTQLAQALEHVAKALR